MSSTNALYVSAGAADNPAEMAASRHEVMVNRALQLSNMGRYQEAGRVFEENVKELSGQVQSLNNQITGGKGVIMGLLLTAGGLGAGATKLVEYLTK